MNGGGRNAMNGAGSVQNSGHAYSRGRHVNSATSAIMPQQVMPGTYSPQGLYQSPQMNDQFHSVTGGSAISRDMDTFPTAPYTPAGQLFMSAAVHNSFATPASIRATRSVTAVTSAKFSMYGTVYNLENSPQPTVMDPLGKTMTQAYQTSDRASGKDIFLRRFVNTQILEEQCKLFEHFYLCRHPNLVPLKSVMVTSDFVMGSNDVIMEYRFINGAKSLKEAFIDKLIGAPEAILWSFTCQMLGLLRSFHEMGMLLRGVHVSKILFVETTGRFYFTGLGMQELLEMTSRTSLSPNEFEEQKKLDVLAVGLILLQLAMHNDKLTPENYAEARFSGYTTNCTELVRCFLLGYPYEKLCSALGERLSMEVAHHEGYADFLLEECNKERHNGRIMRLMMKLNFVLESPMFSNVPEKFYPLRLFNQYLFNQVDEQNRVHVDWGHAYHCLNKLDCGSDENIQLMETDGRSVLVISYADLKETLETTFLSLKTAASRTEVDSQGYALPGSPGSL